MLEVNDTVATLEARVRDLEAALGQNDYELAATFHLTASMGNLLGLLMAVRVATAEMIQQRLGIAADAKVAIHRLRRLLAPYDIKISMKRRVGYFLDPEVKARIRAMVAGDDVPDAEAALEVASGDPPAAQAA